jgi:L-amino acid N-acyltransferase YncA
MEDVEIDTLRAGDIDGVLALQEANQAEHDGTLSARMPRAFFAAILSDMPVGDMPVGGLSVGGLPVIVARRQGRVVGFLVSSPKHPPPEAPARRAMLRAWPGADDAYAYGPVCVAAEERGRGVAAAMFAALRALLPGREGVLFIRSDNAASIRAHAKMGMRQVATFEHDGETMLALTYVG